MAKQMKEKAIDNNESIVLMLAYLCIKDVEGPLADQVKILDRFKLTDSQKAIVCGVIPQSITNARSKAKKVKK